LDPTGEASPHKEDGGCNAQSRYEDEFGVTTQALADRYAGLQFDDLSGEVVARTRDLLTDTLGVAIGGQQLPSSSLVAALVHEMGGRPDSTIIGDAAAPAPLAALVNATMAHGLELDDVDNESSLHPGTVVIPTALAVAEARAASGRDTLTAVVAGYDAMIRIGRAAGPAQQYARGFHPTATCGVFGAAVAAGRLLGLEADALAHALGIAGSFAAGNLEYMSNGAWTKRLQVGGAAQGGTLAAMLAERGYTGPTNILEGPHGFLRSHSASSDVEVLVLGLGDEPDSILDVSIKAFACCRYSHTPVDAVLQLLQRHSIQTTEILAVDVDMVSAGMALVAEPRELKLAPKNSVDAQFSLPYAIAVALERGAAFTDEFTEQSVSDPAIRRWMPLVHIQAAEDLDAFYPKRWSARVKVKTRSDEHELLLQSCRGDPDRRLTDAELLVKFQALAAPYLDSEIALKLTNSLAQFELLADVGTVMRLIRKPAA
jgi:2-methylcitrate dehydratase PrpD